MSVGNLQRLLHKGKPYNSANLLGSTVFRFEKQYIETLDKAFENGCVLDMSESSSELTKKYIDFCDGIESATPVLLALDKVLAEITSDAFDDGISKCIASDVYECKISK